jgi:hypothetical protein
VNAQRVRRVARVAASSAAAVVISKAYLLHRHAAVVLRHCRQRPSGLRQRQWGRIWHGQAAVPVGLERGVGLHMVAATRTNNRGSKDRTSVTDGHHVRYVATLQLLNVHCNTMNSIAKQCAMDGSMGSSHAGQLVYDVPCSNPGAEAGHWPFEIHLLRQKL